MNGFWSYWYFHIPNFILAAVMYTLLGRLVLGFFVPENWDNYIWRAFKRITDPVLHVVRVITPQLLTHTVVVIFAVLWLMAARIGYLVLLLDLGLAPISSQAS
ncbi:YggT family protein [Mesorhizobium sp. J18]|uniref:YggT family protein n=1 Tax=Mesorhizobium sp. J18 TaxID=935263 RepID=UPI00119AF0C6|nr:YggT family protein [Mesorhizobium sp. J18]TWG98450.1 YggT family protein [Mesorhizobium sp. J18]